MTQPFIVLGDKTSHGGVVITADVTCTIDGKPLARVQDLTVCPRCKGVFAISTGAENMLSMGQAPARHGDKTACGASLIAGQIRTFWDDVSDLASSASADVLPGGAKAVAAEVPDICLECLKTATVNGTALVIRG